VGITAAEFMLEARTWIGTPWLHQARAKGIGADCGGFVLGALWAIGYPAEDYVGYNGQVYDARELRNLCDRTLIRVNDVRIGDVLLLRLNRDPTHLGIVGDAGSGPDCLSLIHTYPGKGVREVSLDATWRGLRFVQAYRLRGLEG
jgi:cell wall-associated NlpC family hydrolase